MRTCSALEEFVPSGHLRVAGILDLDPVRARAIAVVSTIDGLCDDALEIMRAGYLEEILASRSYVIDVEQSGPPCGNQPPQPALPFDQRPLPQVLAIYSKQIKRVEVRLLATEQQAFEVAPPARVEAHDFPVDHCVVRLDGVGELLAELRPVLEGVPVATRGRSGVRRCGRALETRRA